MPFDPFGWAAGFLPARLVHRTIRCTMTAVLLGFTLHRFYIFDDYRVKSLWVAESLIFPVLVVAFLFRADPVVRSIGAREILVPLLGSLLPFALLFSPPSPLLMRNQILPQAIFWGMTAATALTVAGMWSLRRSFSITVEARELVTSGPYRLIRHPVYAGEILATAGVAALRLSVVNLVLFGLFFFVQLCRSRWEEVKLSGAFPAYADYARRSWWFWRYREDPGTNQNEKPLISHS